MVVSEFVNVLKLLITLMIIIWMSSFKAIAQPAVVDKCIAQSVVLSNEPVELECVIRAMTFDDGKNIDLNLDDGRRSFFSLFSRGETRAAGQFGIFEQDGHPKVSPPSLVGEEKVWRVNYTLRVVDKEKGVHEIPPLSFPMALYEPGSNESRRFRIVSKPINVNYVSTVVPLPEGTSWSPIDDIDLGSYGQTSIIWKGISFLLIIIPLFFLVLTFFGDRTRVVAIKSQEKKTKNKKGEDYILSPGSARKKILKTLKEIENKLSLFNSEHFSTQDLLNFRALDDVGEFDKALYKDVFDLLRSENHNIFLGHSPEDILRIIDKSESGYRKKALLEIALFFSKFHNKRNNSKYSIFYDLALESDPLINLKEMIKRIRYLRFAVLIDFMLKIKKLFKK